MNPNPAAKAKEFTVVKLNNEKSMLKGTNVYLLALIVILLLIIAFLTLSPVGVLKSTLYPSKLNINQTALITLLTDQKPDIVQVVDPKLTQQDNPESGLFYKYAKKDDVVLIYRQLKIAILFRPATKEVVNVSLLSTPGEF